MSAITQSPETRLGRPRKFQDIEAFKAAIEGYFIRQHKRKKPYTMHGLARALDCSRQTLLNYEQYHDAAEYVDAVKRARECVAEWTEERLHEKGYHPAGSIFSLKNNFGWTDTQVVKHEGGVMLGIVTPVDALRAAVPSFADIQAALKPTVQIAQIPSVNATSPALGTGAIPDATFASDASLSPVPRNS